MYCMPLFVEDWVEVRSKPRKGSQELPSQSPKAKPVESPLLAAKLGCC